MLGKTVRSFFMETRKLRNRVLNQQVHRVSHINSSELCLILTIFTRPRGPARKILDFLSSKVTLENTYMFTNSFLESFYKKLLWDYSLGCNESLGFFIRYFIRFSRFVEQPSYART